MCGQDLATFLALDSGREGPGGADWMVGDGVQGVGTEMKVYGRGISCSSVQGVTKEAIAGIEGTIQ